MEALIAILIFLGGAIWNAFQKRKQEQEEAKPWLPPNRRGEPQPGQPSPPPQRPAPNSPMDWEEQLRRLLEGKPTAPTPPVIVQEPRPAVPPPLPKPFVAAARPLPGRTEREFDESADIGLPVQMPALEQSAQAWQRGNTLEAAVAERLRQVDQRISDHRPAEARKFVSRELRESIELVRRRSTLRTAIVASVILGPPKALED